MNEPNYTAEIQNSQSTTRPSRVSNVLILLAVLGILGGMVVLRARFGNAPPAQAIRPVTFEVRLAETSPGPGLTPTTVSSDPTRTIYLHVEPVIGNEHLESAEAIEVQGDAAIQFSTNTIGAARMRQATAAHIGKPLAIMLDGEVRMAPIVNSPIGGKGVIAGSFSMIEAERIAQGIMSR